MTVEALVSASKVQALRVEALALASKVQALRLRL